VWLDIFSQYQHWIGDVGTAQRPCNWDVVFQLTTAAIGHTCLVFAPWREAVPLRRAWMLWEVLCTLTAQGGKGAASSALRVRLPPAESDDFQMALARRFEVVDACLARIDSRSAECFTREDQAMVHAAIDRTLKGGHTELDALLSEALREWLAAEGRAALMRLPREERATSALQKALGLLLSSLGKKAEAMDLTRETLEALRLKDGDQDPNTIASILNMGMALEANGKLEEAEPLLREALKTSRATLGDRNELTIASINNLGSLLKDRGKLEEAEPLIREALQVRRAMLGDRHFDTLYTMNELGSVLRHQGKLEEAEPLLREALKAKRATLGDRHPITLTSVNDLGLLLVDLKHFKEAEQLLHEALESRRAIYGDSNLNTLNSMNNLGSLLHQQGNLEEAGIWFRRVLEAQRATLGDRDRRTLLTMSNLGTLLQAQGKLQEAEPLLRENVEAMRATLGDRHHNTMCSINNLGTLLQAQGKLQEAEPLLRENVESARATLGDRHPHTLGSIENYAVLLATQGKMNLALPLAIEASRGKLGGQHPETLKLVHMLKEMELQRAPLVGKQVLVQGLEAKPELNNRTGTATAWDGERGRYSVRLQDGSLLSFKPANLKEVLGLQELPDPSAGGLVGEQVLLHGLVAKPELNNRRGIATAWDSERGRYTVRLQDGTMVAFKPENLRSLQRMMMEQFGGHCVRM